MELLFAALLGAGLSLAMALAFAVQRVTGRSGWVDTIWAASVGLGGLAAVLLPAEAADPGRRAAAGVLIGLWSLRLALHIASRTHGGGGDDPRYAAMAATWGERAGWRMFLFLQSQAAAALVLVIAVRLAAINPAPFPRIADFIAVALLVAGIAGAALADWQLARFRRGARPGAICETGLWRWSRHPNYFFEWLGWCAWPLLAIAHPGEHPWGPLALAAPVMMYWLLVEVSGIPPLEQHMLASRGAAFSAYQRRVNAFFPGPRRGAP